jgi:hypothetical protein
MPWLPPGFSFLSGLPEPARQRRQLMPVQAFVDDSGGKGHTRHFVLAGLLADAEAWADFSNEWRACLDQPPKVQIFKMKHAAGLSGHFYGWQEAARDKKLKALARVINGHAQISTHSMIDLDAFAQTWAKRPKPQRDPYFYPFHNTILAAGWTLWDIGWRERFEIIFDEQLIFGPRAKHWYPFYKRMVEIKEPDMATILPVEPKFKSDDEFLPLQAADMFAWCMRNATDNQDPESFAWLLNELKNVKATMYSQYYHLARLQSVMDVSEEIARKGDVPSELLHMFRETAALMKRR